MKIRYNPAIDACCSFIQYSGWDEIKGMMTPGFSYSPELEKWREAAKKILPGLLLHDMDYLLKDFLGLVFLCVTVVLEEGIRTVPDLILRLREYPIEELPEKMFACYATDVPFDEVKDDPAAITSLLARAGGTIRKNEPERFLEFLRFPDAFMRRFLDFFEKYYLKAIAPFEKEAEKLALARAAGDQAVLDDEPAVFFRDYCRLDAESDWSGLEVYISFFDEIDVIQLDEPQALIYGRGRKSLVGGVDIPISEIYRILADESRRNILRMLCRRSWFIRELANELDLTSATISYHMNRLGALDLVEYEKGERKRIYYRANREKAEAMMAALSADILGI